MDAQVPDGLVRAYQKISDTEGNFLANLESDDRFGVSTAGLGDLDGDGVNDMVVGAPYDDDGGDKRGAVYILFMNSNGTVKSHQKISRTAGNFNTTWGYSNKFGTSVANLGDLDGDGVTDIAAGMGWDDDGGPGRGAIYILFLNTDGTVKSHQKISATEGNLTGILDDYDYFGNSVSGLGDLDSDGVADIVVGAYADNDAGDQRGAVYVLLMHANGTVKSYQKISSTVGNFTDALDYWDRFGISVTGLGDLNGDGVPDMAVGAYLDDDGGAGRGAIYVMFMNSDGTLKSYQKISATEGNLTGMLANGDNFGFSVTRLGDLDGDGLPDLAVGTIGDDDGGTNRGALYILFMNLDGTAKSVQKISDTAGNFPANLNDATQFGRSVARLGDLDGDHFSDLAVGEMGPNDGAVYVLFLDNFARSAPTGLIAVAGDEKIDLHWNPSVNADFLRYRIYGGLDSVLTTLVDSTTDGDPNDTSATITGLTNGSTYYYRITEFAGTGIESVYSSEVKASPGPPIIIAASPSFNELNVPAKSAISIIFDTEIDGTTIGRSTFVVYGSVSGYIDGFYSTVGSTVMFTPSNPFMAGEKIRVTLTTGVKKAAGMAVINPVSWEFFTAALGGSGNLSARVDYGAGDMTSSIVTANLDQDGDLDLITANAGSNNISVLLNNGDGTYAPQVVYAVENQPHSVIAGDVDQDGDLDLITANAGSNNISVLLNNGDGTYAPQVVYTVENQPHSIIAGDVDQDGDLDLITANAGSNNISVLLNNGDGTYAPQVVYTVENQPNSIVTANLDQDGDLDLITANAGSNNISVLLNNGDGTYAPQVVYTVQNQPYSVMAGDVDQDGDLDLITANIESDNLSVLLNIDAPDTTPPAAPSNLTATAGAGQIILRWHPNTESDFLRYRIYGRHSGGLVALVDSSAGGNANDTTVTLINLSNGTTYHYYITAVDSSGNESNYSDEVSAMPGTMVTFLADITDLVLEGFNPAFHPMTIRGDFNNWGTTDPMSLIEETPLYSANILIAADPDSVLDWRFHVGPDEEWFNAGWDTLTYRYHTISDAVDTLGPMHPMIFADPIIPKMVIWITPKPWDHRLVLAWEPSRERDLSHYLVYSSTTAGFVPGQDNLLAIVPDTSAVLDLNDLINGTRYFFRVLAVDHAGNNSPLSEEISGIPGEILAPFAQFGQEHLELVTEKGVDMSVGIEIGNGGNYPLRIHATPQYGDSLGMQWLIPESDITVQSDDTIALYIHVKETANMDEGYYEGNIRLNYNSAGDSTILDAEQNIVVNLRIVADGIVTTGSEIIPVNSTNPVALTDEQGNSLGLVLEFSTSSAGEVSAIAAHLPPPTDSTTVVDDPDGEVISPVFAPIYWEITTDFQGTYSVDIQFSFAGLIGAHSPNKLRLGRRQTYSGAMVAWSLIALDHQSLDAGNQTITVLQQGKSSQWAIIADSSDNPFIDILALGDRDGVPNTFALYQNYPNPFNPSSTIRFDLPKTSKVDLRIYDILGQEVIRLVDENQTAGYHKVIWSGLDARGRSVSSGVYIARLVTSGYIKSIKMVLLK